MDVFHDAFEVVFVDGSGLNIFAELSIERYRWMQHEASLALRNLDNLSTNEFQALFMTPLPPEMKFDVLCRYVNSNSMVPQAGRSNSNSNSSTVPQAGWSNSNSNSSTVPQAGWSNSNSNSSTVPQAGWSNSNSNSSTVPQAGWSNSNSNSSTVPQAGWSNSNSNSSIVPQAGRG